MKTTLGLASTLLAMAAVAAVVGVHAFAGGNKTNLKADPLTGYQESTPAAIVSNASGTFEATINDANQTIDFTLTFDGLAANATASHIHIGNRAQNGGVSGWICGGGGQPPCPAAKSGTVTGTITPANITGPTAQGVPAGGFDQLVAAMRAGASYVNVHDGTYPAGEIRGQINDDNNNQPS
jgi:hypothetical protein